MCNRYRQGKRDLGCHQGWLWWGNRHEAKGEKSVQEEGVNLRVRAETWIQEWEGARQAERRPAICPKGFVKGRTGGWPAMKVSFQGDLGGQGNSLQQFLMAGTGYLMSLPQHGPWIGQSMAFPSRCPRSCPRVALNVMKANTCWKLNSNLWHKSTHEALKNRCWHYKIMS